MAIHKASIARQWIAFYAPLKSPKHPIPSGDRKIARLFIEAAERAGFDVELASQLRMFDKRGDAVRQARLISVAKREAQRVIKRWSRRGVKPVAWVSYHLYYKAPDIIGPLVCKALDIPYIVAEASWASKRADGAWSAYHVWVDRALRAAKRVVCINPIDRIALEQYFSPSLLSSSPLVSLPVFAAPVIALGLERKELRAQLSRRFNLDAGRPWLVCVAMMRAGDKQASFDLLAQSLADVTLPYQCLIIGSGPCEVQVKSAFAANSQVEFAGALDNILLQQWLPAFDVMVWPAVNEALGMIFLEAGMAGLASVAGDEGGVSSIIRHTDTGLLCPPRDAHAFTQAIEQLIADPQRLQNMKDQAKHKVITQHSIDSAAEVLRRHIDAVQ